MEQVKENMLKTLKNQCFLMFHLFFHKWNIFKINGTNGTNARGCYFFNL